MHTSFPGSCKLTITGKIIDTTFLWWRLRWSKNYEIARCACAVRDNSALQVPSASSSVSFHWWRMKQTGQDQPRSVVFFNKGLYRSFPAPTLRIYFWKLCCRHRALKLLIMPNKACEWAVLLHHLLLGGCFGVFVRSLQIMVQFGNNARIQEPAMWWHGEIHIYRLVTAPLSCCPIPVPLKSHANNRHWWHRPWSRPVPLTQSWCRWQLIFFMEASVKTNSSSVCPNLLTSPACSDRVSVWRSVCSKNAASMGLTGKRVCGGSWSWRTESNLGILPEYFRSWLVILPWLRLSIQRIWAPTWLQQPTRSVVHIQYAAHTHASGLLSIWRHLSHDGNTIALT